LFRYYQTAKEALERDNRAITECDAQRNKQLEHLSTALSASDERIRVNCSFFIHISVPTRNRGAIFS
jgi:hypothetical protein